MTTYEYASIWAELQIDATEYDGSNSKQETENAKNEQQNVHDILSDLLKKNKKSDT